MENNIPKVFFHRSKKEEMEFEVLTLKHFFARNIKLSCPLDRVHRVDFYQILYFTEGQGKHYVDFNAYNYSKGSLFFISMGQVQAFEVNLKADGFIMLFTEAFFIKNMFHSDLLSFLRLFNYHQNSSIIDTSESVFDTLLNEIYNEYSYTESFAREEMLTTLLKFFFIKVERVKRTFDSVRKNSNLVIKFTEFKYLLGIHFRETRNAGDYAQMLNISYNHLNKIIKNITGKTAKSFIDTFIILESKRHLAVSEISIKELTYLMGFDEQTNFVKYFKKHTSFSPVAFRKMLTG